METRITLRLGSPVIPRSHVQKEKKSESCCWPQKWHQFSFGGGCFGCTFLSRIAGTICKTKEVKVRGKKNLGSNSKGSSSPPLPL